MQFKIFTINLTRYHSQILRYRMLLFTIFLGGQYQILNFQIREKILLKSVQKERNYAFNIHFNYKCQNRHILNGRTGVSVLIIELLRFSQGS